MSDAWGSLEGCGGAEGDDLFWVCDYGLLTLGQMWAQFAVLKWIATPFPTSTDALAGATTMEQSMIVQPLHEVKNRLNSRQNCINDTSNRGYGKKRSVSDDWGLPQKKRGRVDDVAASRPTEPEPGHKSACEASQKSVGEESMFSIEGILRAHPRERLYVECIRWTDKHMSYLPVRFVNMGKITGSVLRGGGKAAAEDLMRAASQLRSCNNNVQRGAVTELLQCTGLRKIL